MLKKIKAIIGLLILKTNFSFAENWSTDIKDSMIKWQENTVVAWIKENEDWFSALDWIINYIQNSLTWLILVIALWVFLYIWIKLVIARWNPEEFKKQLMHFVYAWVWIFLVSAAWAIVKLVASLNIN